MMAMSISPRHVKHIPQRTCLACRKVKTKGELVRLVRTPGEGIEVDISGKKAGRGAYLCSARECWETGLKGGQLERALRTKVTPNNREQLIKFGESSLKISG